MHQADHEPTPAPEGSPTLHEIPDPDAVARTPEGPPPNVLIVRQTASRGISPRAALALLVLLLAIGGLTARGLVSDWEGLLTETQERWTTPHESAPKPSAVVQTPQDTPDAAKKAEPGPAPAPEPRVDDLLAAAPIPSPEPEPKAKVEDNAQAQARPEPAPEAKADGTKAAMADIEQEAERLRKEQEELAKLRKQAERDAPPPAARPDLRRFGFGVMPMPIHPRDRQQLARLIREQQLRQIQEMERIFDEIERAQAGAPHGWPPMVPRLPRPNFGLVIPPAPHLDEGNGDDPQFVPAPPEPGLPEFAPPPAWPGLNNRPVEAPRPRRGDNRA